MRHVIFCHFNFFFKYSNNLTKISNWWFCLYKHKIIAVITKYLIWLSAVYLCRNRRQLNQARNTATAPASMLRQSESLKSTGAIKTAVDTYSTHSTKLLGSRKYRSRCNRSRVWTKKKIGVSKGRGIYKGKRPWANSGYLVNLALRATTKNVTSSGGRLTTMHFNGLKQTKSLYKGNF